MRHYLRNSLLSFCIVTACCTSSTAQVLRAPASGVDQQVVIDAESMMTAASHWSLEDLEVLALTQNPSLAQAEARLQAAQARCVQVGLPPNPVIGYLGQEMGASGTAGMQGGFIGQEIITGGKLRLERAMAAQQIEQAAHELEAQRLRVLTDVRTAFFQTLSFQRQVLVTERLVSISEETLQTIDRLLQAMQRSRLDMLQSRIEAESAHVRLDVARANYVAAWRRLAAIIGAPSMERAPLVGELEQLPEAQSWEEALTRIVEQNPLVAAAFAESQRAAWAVQRAEAEVIPNIDLQVAVMHDNVGDEELASVQLGLPVPLWNKNQGGIRQAEAELRAARRAVDRTQLELAYRLAATYGRLVQSQKQAERYARRVVPDAEEALQLVTRGYSAGDVDYLNLLNAQRTYFQATLAYLEALGAVHMAHAEMEGLLLSGSFNQQAMP